MTGLVTCWVVAASLGQLGDADLTTTPLEAEVVTALGQMADSDPEIVRRGLDTALRLNIGLFERPLQSLVRSSDEAVRARAVEVMARLDWPERPADLLARVELLGELARDPVTAVRLAAIQGLGTYPLPEAMRELADAQSGAPA